MANILYAKKITNRVRKGLPLSSLKPFFSDVASIYETLILAGKRTACFFIDPLMDHFEAHNAFYFDGLGFGHIDKINCYKTGAGPIHALRDAQTLINSGVLDAVFVFGYEPLLDNKEKYGKEAIQNAMDIFHGKSILSCYNEIAEAMCVLLDISEFQFIEIADLLYKNYLRTFTRINGTAAAPPGRGRNMADAGGSLFYLADCANPNVNFAGGVVLCSNTIWKNMRPPGNQPVNIVAASCRTVKSGPGNIAGIAGGKSAIFPHLAAVADSIRAQSGICLKTEFLARNLLLDVYTCYPPIPLAFLIAAGFIENVGELPEFLAEYEITIDGGLNLAGAPWNNPVLSSIISMHDALQKGEALQGLVHGNGGIGEAQGAALLQRAD